MDRKNKRMFITIVLGIGLTSFLVAPICETSGGARVCGQVCHQDAKGCFCSGPCSPGESEAVLQGTGTAN